MEQSTRKKIEQLAAEVNAIADAADDRQEVICLLGEVFAPLGVTAISGSSDGKSWSYRSSSSDDGATRSSGYTESVSRGVSQSTSASQSRSVSTGRSSSTSVNHGDNTTD